MNEKFTLPITVNRKTIYIECILKAYSYGHRFVAMVNDVEIVFEKDDQGEYRAVNYNESASAKVDPEVVKAILDSLTANFG